jgi:hypothetical protein
MVLIIALARGAKVRIAPANAVITSHFVRMMFSLRVQVASEEWKSRINRSGHYVNSRTEPEFAGISRL